MDEYTRKILGLPYKDLFSYWQHYWKHCIENLTDKDNVSFKIVGPRMLLKDLMEELEGHGLSNSDNIEFFKREISCLDKSDEVFHSLCHPIIACLLQRLCDKLNQDSCILLCKSALNKLSVKRYFTLLVDWLAKTIDESSANNFENRKKINDITHLVIAEFVAEGFVLDEIKNYSMKVPGVVIAEGGDVLAAPKEYASIKESDYSSEEDYHKAVAELIKTQDVFKQVEVLKYYYYIDPQEAFFIVRLNGLKGEINDYIGDINIYSPKLKKYIHDEESLSDIEDVTEDRNRVNAAVPIEFISIEQAKIYATAKLEEILDIIMLTYRTATPVTIATNKYAVVSDGKEIGCSVSEKGDDPTMASRDEMIRYMESFDLTEIKGVGFKFMSDKHSILEVGQGTLNRRLKNSTHWYSKAIAADKNVDVLLYSWFAVEGLLKLDNKTQAELLDNTKDVNVLKVIQEFVTCIICRQYFYGYLREKYSEIFYVSYQFENFYDIPPDIISKAGLDLKTGDRYRDSDFLNTLPEVIECVNDDIVRDELTQLHDFYQDAEGVKRKENQIKNDLLMIYRLRNMIVHNAALSCVNISFYAREAKFLALQVIRYVLDRVGRNKTIEEIVLGAKLNYQIFMADFDGELKRLKNGE